MDTSIENNLKLGKKAYTPEEIEAVYLLPKPWISSKNFLRKPRRKLVSGGKNFQADSGSALPLPVVFLAILHSDL